MSTREVIGVSLLVIDFVLRRMRE
jgi:hypothetical protein